MSRRRRVATGSYVYHTLSRPVGRSTILEKAGDRRYVERSALRANLVASAEQRRWISLWHRLNGSTAATLAEWRVFSNLCLACNLEVIVGRWTGGIIALGRGRLRQGGEVFSWRRRVASMEYTGRGVVYRARFPE